MSLSKHGRLLWHLLAVIFLATLAACASGGARTPSTPAKVTMPSREVIAGILESGRQAYAQGRYERAINLFRRVQEGYPRAPEQPEATLLLANALEANGDTALALTEYRRLTGDYPQSSQAQVARTKIPDLERRLPPLRPSVSSQIIGAFPRPDAIETLDDQNLSRIRQSGANTLVVRVARNRPSPPSLAEGGSAKGALPPGERSEAGVYFKTDWAPVVQDRLAELVKRAHGQSLQVWAAVSVRGMDWIDPALGWSDWRFNASTAELVRAETLDLMHPAVPEYLVGFFSDLAASGVDGVLLLANPASGPGDGFSSHARRSFERDVGQPIDPGRLQLAQARDRSLDFAPEFWRWIGWKQREQLKVVEGVMRAVRRTHPGLKVALEVHPEAVTSPRAALAWYAEDILDLRRYRIDYIALPFSASLETRMTQLADSVRAGQLLLVADPAETNQVRSVSLKAGSGVIYRENSQPSGLTNRGR